MIFYGIALGILAGIVSGMGIGGGTILIPALVLLGGISQQSAQSINLIYFMPTAAAALVVHVRNKNIARGVVWRLICFGSIMAIAASMIAVRTDGTTLKKLFGAFLLLMGAFEFFKKEET